MMLLIVSLAMTAQESSDQKDPLNVVVFNRRTATSSSSIKRTPSLCDLILYIDETSLTLVVNGDFGIGTYRVLDCTTGLEVDGMVNTADSRFVVIPFEINETSELSFDIEFADGRCGHLTWNP